MVSRENKVTVAFVAIAVLLLFVVSEYLPRSTWAGSAVVLVVGVLAPLLVNTYLDRTRQ